MNILCPGDDGDLLPAGTLVFRIAENAEPSPAAIETGKASPMMFELSSADKKSPCQRLSIWVEQLTIADQAWGFLTRKPRQAIVLCLSVDEVHEIPAPVGLASLRVEWEKGFGLDQLGAEVPDTRPGASGHCGIAGLNQAKSNKNQRKGLRSALADIAKISPVPVPHEFPQDQLRIAAFFIFENRGRADAPPETHWVEAIRQFRRALVSEKADQRCAGT